MCAVVLRVPMYNIQLNAMTVDTQNDLVLLRCVIIETVPVSLKHVNSQDLV